LISYRWPEGPFNETASVKASWEDSFLEWFSELGISMCEIKLKLGALEYYHFSTLNKMHPLKKLISGFGSHQNRKVAALKCAAETLERTEVLEYFSTDLSTPAQLQTSNGWAVHGSKNQAQCKAFGEALERHLLLKSFFLYGWDGFKLVQKIETDSMTIFLNVGKYTYQGQVPILAAVKSKKFVGVSFGYGLGELDQMNSSDFWISAIFEACDRVLISGAGIKTAPTNNWIREELHYFLNTPFDFSVFKENSDPLFFELEKNIATVDLVTLDLGKKKNLDFPLYAAFASGGNLIPLFTKKNLDPKTSAYLLPILNSHQIFEIPERHPIL